MRHALPVCAHAHADWITINRIIISVIIFGVGLSAGWLLGARGGHSGNDTLFTNAPQPSVVDNPDSPPDQARALPQDRSKAHSPTVERETAIIASRDSASASGRSARRQSPSPAEIQKRLKFIARPYQYSERLNRLIYELAAGIDTRDIPHYLMAAQQLPDTDYAAMRFSTALLARWAEEAPREAMNWAMALPSTQRRDGSMTAALDSWTRVDPAAAEAWVRENRTWKPRQAWQTFLTALAATDPEKAVTIAGTLPPEIMANRRMLEYPIIQAWTQTDPAAAIAWAENQGSPSQRKQLINTAVSLWAVEEPLAAATYAAAVKSRDERRALYAQIAQTWVKRDPDAALRWVQGLEPLDQPFCYQAAAGGLASSDPDRALQVAGLISNTTQRYQALSGMMYMLGGQRTAQLIKSLPADSKRATLIEQSLWALNNDSPADMIAFIEEMAPSLTARTLQRVPAMAAEYNIPKALELCNLIKEAQAQQSALQGVLSRWASDEPAAAMAYAEALPDGPSRTNCINQGAAVWANADPVTALDWAARYKDWPYPNPLSQVLNAWANRDPREAVAYVEKLESGTTFKQRVAMDVLQQWSRKEPSAALVWAQGFPEGETRDAAVETVVSQWSGTDVDAAETYVRTMPATKGRDKAASTVINRLCNESPERAAGLVSLIGDETMRTRCVRAVMQNWLRNDPEPAKAWLGRSALSEDEKRAILGGGR